MARNSKGEIIWQYSPEWLKELWGIKDEETPDTVSDSGVI